MPPSSPQRVTRESGNAFFIVMIGVVLFAALMFTFTRGARQGGDNMSQKQAEIAATDIITYTQIVQRAVTRIYGRGFSENELSFENSFFSGHENDNCAAAEPRCHIFSKTGGGATYRPLGKGWSLSQTDWVFTGANQVQGVGADCADSSCSELIMMIEDVPSTLCTIINEQLGLTSDGAAPPTDANADSIMFASTFAYNGAAIIGDTDPVLAGKRSACFLETGSSDYVFYHTLMER